jgi:phage-related protein
MGIGNGIGVGWGTITMASGPIFAIVDNFAQRVAADGGIMEAFGCVVEAILDLPQ